MNWINKFEGNGDGDGDRDGDGDGDDDVGTFLCLGDVVVVAAAASNWTSFILSLKLFDLYILKLVNGVVL